jgi:hypothetical protein
MSLIVTKEMHRKRLSISRIKFAKLKVNFSKFKAS